MTKTKGKGNQRRSEQMAKIKGGTPGRGDFMALLKQKEPQEESNQWPKLKEKVPKEESNQWPKLKEKVPKEASNQRPKLKNS